ncbi:MAG: metallophosphoesterase family protein [Candidatus Heimdallarchaeota archaeon]|nr:metallophosphoesterase family protein [Candidatus Heimdallarchaeota archaeon]
MVKLIQEDEEQTKVVTSESIMSTGTETIEEVNSWFDTEQITIDAKKICVISDIHSNYVALEAVVKDMETREFDAVINLGDLVGYYTEPNDVVEQVRKIANVSVLGNHDFAIIEPEALLYSTLQEAAKEALDHNKNLLESDHFSWLKTLPLKIILKTPYATLTLVHGDPVTIFGYIYGLNEELFENSIKQSLKHVTTDYLLVGHSHLQGEYYDNSTNRIYINPGAVGQPRDKDPRAAYAIIDLEKRTHKLIRVPYDIAKVRGQIIDCCLPAYLGDRLEHGE